ncbi:hypothetical protein NMY22_g8227 [Coprinellus aureogranulatus]|nr:hypothetical protein NMY22_g8227 [Coprinellus aureogranulatus]
MAIPPPTPPPPLLLKAQTHQNYSSIAVSSDFCASLLSELHSFVLFFHSKPSTHPSAFAAARQIRCFSTRFTASPSSSSSSPNSPIRYLRALVQLQKLRFCVTLFFGLPVPHLEHFTADPLRTLHALTLLKRRKTPLVSICQRSFEIAGADEFEKALRGHNTTRYCPSDWSEFLPRSVTFEDAEGSWMFEGRR